MKPRILSLILTFALLLSAFAGCSTETEPSAGSSGQSPENSDTPAETEPDYSWFSFPEETGKLEIYSPGNAYSSLLNPAIEIFRDLYPEIEVSYTILSDDEFETRIRTEIPAGRGPDLVLMADGTFRDIYKTMQTDLFEDLNPWFGTDDEIALSDFVKPVMDGGVLNRKRYLAPLNYRLPVYLTTQSILDEVGMTADEVETCDGFCEAATRFHEKYPDSTLFFDFGGLAPYLSDLVTLSMNFGIRFINFETGELDIDEARFRQCADLVKLYYDPDYDTDEDAVWDIPYYSAGGGLHLKLFPYDKYSANGYSRYRTCRDYLGADGEKPVQFVPANQYGGVTAEIILSTAIPKGAANKANAWKLLKILLSEEIQGGHDEKRWGNSYFWVGEPVRLSSTKAKMDHGAEMTPDGPEFDEFVELVQSPTDAQMFPLIYNKYLNQEIMPYVRGERSWEDCWKSFVNTMELYKDE
jgi:ABC-type glycerol-3-phosphate transport system substrate-binding protein